MDVDAWEDGLVGFGKESCIEFIRHFLSDELYFALKACTKMNGGVDALEEIRLRSDREVYITVGRYGKKQNVAVGVYLSSDELTRIFNKMCSGSLYAYSESISKGYISLKHGIRIGVCGHAAVEGGHIVGVYDISALNIRIPRSDIRLDKGLGDLVCKNIRAGVGTLIFSPPSQGKTTCLRSLVYELASGEAPIRVSVVDTRGELSFLPENKGLNVDMLIGYPKAEGIRMATLFMNPQVIICDEIGGEDEATAILDSQNCGVPLVATAHADRLDSLMRKRGIAALHKSHVFGTYVSVRIGAFGGFELLTYSWGEAERAGLDNRLVCNST